MQIYVRGAAELIPLELENDDTVQDIRVSNFHSSIVHKSLFSCTGICR